MSLSVKYLNNAVHTVKAHFMIIIVIFFNLPEVLFLVLLFSSGYEHLLWDHPSEVDALPTSSLSQLSALIDEGTKIRKILTRDLEGIKRIPAGSFPVCGT